VVKEGEEGFTGAGEESKPQKTGAES